MIKKITLLILLFQSNYAFSDFWDNVSKMDAQTIRSSIKQQGNQVILYCPTCGDNGIVEYLQVNNLNIGPSNWAENQFEVRTQARVIFKAEPVINNGVMSLKNMNCAVGKLSNESKVSADKISLNYHFLPENNRSSWTSFARVVQQKQLPESPTFTLQQQFVDKLQQCEKTWQRQFEK
ncbi:hypothetical protein MNBD_GAMMA10-3100 [hydrothermal vent metagenome]|uniref:Uncharacterized protein n=1 Tax=hydrothermal vent metagenome TaxID=652676 RepID=A0A3B0XSZ5_9ZZZZ